MKKHFGYFDGLRGLGLEMTEEQALSASHSGSCDEDVAELCKLPEISAQLDQIGAEQIRAGLKESGAWDNELLSDDEANRQRAVWIAACFIKDDLREEKD